jgi:hypothetical protein
MSSISKHSLALDIIVTACPNIIRIADASVYADGIPVNCEQLEILVPGYSTPVVFNNDAEVESIIYDLLVEPNSTAVDAISTSTTTAVFDLDDYTSVAVGQLITGTGIPDNSIITVVNGTTSITITFPVVAIAPVAGVFNAITDIKIYEINTGAYAVSGDGIMRNFDIRYAAADLGTQALFPSTLENLPDGIYTIRYSVSPNDKVYVKYYHLRTTILMNTYFKELCKLQLNQCEPTPEIRQKLNDLRYIRMLIDAAKAKAEYCHSTSQAIDMYNYATTLLSKYQNGCCVTCC